MASADARPILLLTHVFPRALDDSMGAFLLQLSDAVAARGATVHVVAPHAPGLANEATLGAARVHRFHYAPARWEQLAYTGTMHERVARGLAPKLLFGLFNAAFWCKTLSVLRSTHAAVLHAHWWLPGGLAGAIASALTRTPLVITTHGTDVEMLRRTRWARPLARWVLKRARAVTCGSEYLRGELLALSVVEAARVSIIPMPVGQALRAAADALPDIPPAETPAHPTVLTVARLTEQKSIDTLIDAVARLGARGRTVQLKIVGDGNRRAALEEQTARLGIRDRVTFLGARPQAELPRYYRECSVFVLPSIREGMGLVLAEALWCGAPVIAARSGGVTDIVLEGETGLLVPERDPGALADAIEGLLDDPARAARLAANGRARVRERFAPERVAIQFTELYAHVLQR